LGDLRGLILGTTTLVIGFPLGRLFTLPSPEGLPVLLGHPGFEPDFAIIQYLKVYKRRYKNSNLFNGGLRKQHAEVFLGG